MTTRTMGCYSRERPHVIIRQTTRRTPSVISLHRSDSSSERILRPALNLIHRALVEVGNTSLPKVAFVPLAAG